MSLETKGRVKVIEIAATAGNVNTELSPGLGKRYKFLNGLVTMVADATVQNRYLHIEVRTVDDDVMSPTFRGPTATAASETKLYALWDKDLGDIADTKGFTFSGTDNCIILPSIVDGDSHLLVAWSGGQAGDSYTGFIAVIEY